MKRIAHNKLDRAGQRYGKLLALKELEGSRWLCLCDCGNETSVLSTNLANMKKNNRGCLRCKGRKEIAGEKIGMLTAVIREQELWVFKCDCGNEIKGTVREFHANLLRSCGCMGNVHGSWVNMMGRCYNPKSNRFKYYGGRGIRVHFRWHKFENFLKDMGECPKRHTLSRKNCEKNYGSGNCIWEHITRNTADTFNGIPTKPGRTKGAKIRI